MQIIVFKKFFKDRYIQKCSKRLDRILQRKTYEKLNKYFRRVEDIL